MTINEDGFRSFFELSLDLFLIVDFEGVILAANGAWKDVLGYERSELLKRSLFEFVHKSDLDGTNVQMDRSAQGLDVTNFENRWVSRDGSLRWLRWRSRVDHEKKLVFGVAVDVTSEKAHLSLLKSTQNELEAALKSEIEAKETLKFQQDRLQSLILQTPGLACVLRGPNHVFELANEGYQSLFGGREILGKAVSEVVKEVDKEILELLDRVYKGERSVGKNVTINADWLGDGKIFPRTFDFIYEPIFSNDRQPEGIWVWALDVTEQFKIERQSRISERMASLGRLAAGVAHEINNPLAYALGNLELCISNPHLHPSLKTYLEKSVDGIDRVATIVRGLRVFSRFDESKLVQTEAVAEINAALSIASAELRRSKANVTFKSPDTLKFWAPRGAICQIALNLIVNSAHAITETDLKEILIQIEERPNGQIELLVEDTGSGIDRKILDSIFDPFLSTKEVGQGTGLGLSIIHGLVTSLKGTISVFSEVGKGTAIRIALPKNANELKQTDERSESGALSTPAKSIWVIDDEVELREVIRSSLLDYKVQTFENVKSAIERYEKESNSTDVILCDLSLRGETGKDFFELFTSKWPGDQHKIIFMTGGATNEAIARWLETTPNKVLRKPFRARDLTRLLEPDRA